MRKIAVINQKGGVGKTTTTINLAFGLAKKGNSVLILDLDGQGNIGTCLQVESKEDMYSLLVEGADPRMCITKVSDNVDVITSNDTLEKAEVILTGQPSRETILKRSMKDIENYDFVLMDCPPSLGLLNQNALLYADEAVIPVSTDFLGKTALFKMMSSIDQLNQIFDHELKVAAIVPTLYDKRNKTCISNLNDIKNNYDGVVIEPIRMNSKLKEMPMSGQSIFGYAKYSRGAKDYLKLVDKVLEGLAA